MRRFDDQRQAQIISDLVQVSACIELRIARGRQAFRQPDDLGGDLVHGHSTGHDAAASVRNTHLFERALQAAVFAEATVQRDEDAVESLHSQLGQALGAWIKCVGVNALALERIEHASAGHDRHVAFGGTTAKQHANFAHCLDIGRS